MLVGKLVDLAGGGQIGSEGFIDVGRLAEGQDTAGQVEMPKSFP